MAGSGCGFEPEWSGINVNASEEWIGATVAIDGREAGKLEYLMLHDSAWEKSLKKQHGDSPAFRVVALNVALDTGTFPRGVHKVRVEKVGRGVAEGEFTFPDPRGSTVQFLSINGQTLENSPGPDAHGSHP